MFLEVVHHWKKFQNDRLHSYFNNKIYIQATTKFSL